MSTYGSLFSGVGGFDMGFDQAGYDCLFQVEWDKHCQQILARHWPDVPRWSNVQDVNGAELPPCDVLTFGSPCQDLSVAGKRAGIDGGRSSMFFEATRIIREMRDATGNTYPRIVVWENVPGALSSNRGADFQAVIDEMANCGSLLTEWAVLDAQHFGVPQRRRRIFLVAVLDPAIASRCPDPLLPVAEGRRGDYAKGIPAGEVVAALTANGVGTCGADDNQAQAGHLITAVKAKRAMSNIDFDRWEETDLCPTLNAFDNGGESRATVIAFSAGNSAKSYGIAITEDGTPPLRAGASGTNQVPTIAFTAQRVGEAPRIYEDSTPALLSRMGTGGNNTPMVSQPTIAFGWQEQRYAGDTHEEITTALTTTKTQAIHQPEHAVRRLTPLECERLMGWPDNHTRYKADGTEQADTHRYKQCGNGVATPVAQWVARQIMQVLRG